MKSLVKIKNKYGEYSILNIGSHNNGTIDGFDDIRESFSDDRHDSGHSLYFLVQEDV